MLVLSWSYSMMLIFTMQNGRPPSNMPQQDFYSALQEPHCRNEASYSNTR